MNPWIPEFHVTKELAISLIASQFPQLKLEHIQVLDSGWDNIVYQINEHLLFRFPQREMAVVGVEHEIRCLPVLEKYLEKVPRVQFVGKPDSNYPWPFFGYQPVAGQEPASIQISDEERIQIAKSLGAFLCKLHAPKAQSQLKLDLPQDPLGRLDFKKRIPMTLERMDQLEGMQVELKYQQLKRILLQAQETPKLDCNSIVHGDLHFRHLMISDSREISGLIDWGDIHLNDPAADLQIYWSFFSPKARDVFRKAYGPISEVQAIQSRSFGVFVNIALLVSSLDQGKHHIAEEAKRSLATLLLE